MNLVCRLLLEKKIPWPPRDNCSPEHQTNVFLMIRRPPRSTRKESSAASDVYKRQDLTFWKYYDSKNKFPEQKNLNIQYNCIFLKLKNILYEKFFEYCKKNKYFTSHKLMYKTDNLKNDVLISTDIVSINFTKYEPIIHDCNVWHSENSFISLDESTRITAFIVYLNDVYKGGETEFYFQNLKIKPKIGRIALFSPDWMCTHKGNVSLDNSKYILTGWFHTKIHLNKTLFPFYTLKYDKIII